MGLPLAAGPLGATVLSHMSVSQQIDRAEFIVLGVATASETRESPNKRFLQTCFTIDVGEVLKGPSPLNTLSLCFPGGQIGERGYRLAGSPMPQIGVRSIFFIEAQAALLLNPLVGWGSGLISEAPNANGGATLARNGDGLFFADRAQAADQKLDDLPTVPHAYAQGAPYEPNLADAQPDQPPGPLMSFAAFHSIIRGQSAR